MADSAPSSCSPVGPIPLTLGPGTHALCSCGRSRQGAFCDGAHLGTGRVSRLLELHEETTILICGCGATRRPPLCDGSHARASLRACQSRRSWWKFWEAPSAGQDH